MAETPPHDDVKILPPDRTMQRKIGAASLDQLLSPQVVAAAEQVIEKSSDDFLTESMADIVKLEQCLKNLAAQSERPGFTLREIVGSTFSLTVKSGIGGYDLISRLSKSLEHQCELLMNADELTQPQLTLIGWHIESLRRLLDLKVKGSGGAVGEAIVEELKKLDDATAP